MSSFVGNIVSRLSGHQHQMLMHVGPLIKERQEWIAEYGPNYPDKPVCTTLSGAASKL